MKINENELIKKAKEALKNSYSNYSHFKVGAAIELKDGNFIIGTNIENASFGLTNCAERSALFAAYSLGYRKEDIIAMSIATESNKMVAPCGACRQVMAELILPDTPVYLVYGKENVCTFKTSIKELLPYSFGEDDLNV